MARNDHDYSAPLCPICGTPMTLVLIKPRVASFSELHTFHCFACGDVRAVEQDKTHYIRAAVWPRARFFH
jgi:hypothetical protein